MYMTLNPFMQTNTLHHKKNISVAVEEELLIVHINLKHPIHHGVKDRYDITNKFYILKTPIFSRESNIPSNVTVDVQFNFFL